MADISTWSPVDASNNQPPPDGWPEGMAPSGVNDSGRALMGAVRRFYDQIIAGSLSLPYLPITGGSLTGDLYTTGAVTAAGTVTGAAVDSNGNIGAAGAASIAGSITAGGDVAAVGTVSGQQLTSSGNASVAGAITTVVLNASGTVTGATVNSNGNIGAAGSATIAGNITSGGTVSAHAFVDTDGLFSVFDVLRDLEARVEALERNSP